MLAWGGCEESKSTSEGHPTCSRIVGESANRAFVTRIVRGEVGYSCGQGGEIRLGLY